MYTNNAGIVKLIETLKEVNFIYSHLGISNSRHLEESVVNYTVQYLSDFVFFFLYTELVKKIKI